MNDSAITILVVDDEPAARTRLRELLAKQPTVAAVLESPDGPHAVRTIRRSCPDLVFLDVQMPVVTGFDVLRRVGGESMPAVVFVTAYAEHAVRAFEFGALDYLLKPFSDDRFASCFERTSRRLAQGSWEQLSIRLDALIESVARPGEMARRLTRIGVPTRGGVRLVEVARISHLLSEGVYVRLFCGPKSYLLRQALSRLEQQLDSNSFVRIHRSTIVNIDHVESISPLFHGEMELALRGGSRLKVSRSRAPQLRQLLRL